MILLRKKIPQKHNLKTAIELGAIQKQIMSEYYKIKAALIPSLEKAGLSLTEEKIQSDLFGSSYSEFLGKGLSYRIVWNGKDGCGYIQAFENQNWLDLKAFAPENTHAAFEAALIRMRIALIEHIALAKLVQKRT